MTLAWSGSVVRGAHIQAFFFFSISRSRSVARRGHVQAFARKTRADSQDHGRWTAVHMSKHSPFCLWKALSRSRSVARRVRKHVRRNHLVWTPFEAIALPFSPNKHIYIFFFLNWESRAGHTERRQRTREITGRHHTRDKEQNVMWWRLCIFWQDSSWSGAVHEAQSDAALQVGHARRRWATEKRVLCGNSTRLASEQRRRRHRSW